MASFVETLRRDAWICDPRTSWFSSMTFDSEGPHAHAASTGAYVSALAEGRERTILRGPFPNEGLADWLSPRREADMRIIWPVERLEAVPLRYPVNAPSPVSREDTYYNFEIWLGRDFVYPTSELIEPFDDEACSCGESLVYHPETESHLFYEARIRVRCKNCGTEFDPSQRSARVRDPWSDEESEVPGGATFRFAVVVDCGKCFSEGLSGADEALRKLCEAHFGRPFQSIVDLY
jgi:hypothetical protein